MHPKSFVSNFWGAVQLRHGFSINSKVMTISFSYSLRR